MLWYAVGNHESGNTMTLQDASNSFMNIFWAISTEILKHAMLPSTVKWKNLNLFSSKTATPFFISNYDAENTHEKGWYSGLSTLEYTQQFFFTCNLTFQKGLTTVYRKIWMHWSLSIWLAAVLKSFLNLWDTLYVFNAFVLRGRHPCLRCIHYTCFKYSLKSENNYVVMCSLETSVFCHLCSGVLII